MTVAEFQLIVVIALILVPLERLLPLHRGNKTLRDGLPVDLLHVFVSGLIIRAGTLVTALVLAAVCARLIPGSVQQAVRGQPGWLQVVELLLVSDLCFYLAHRLCHSVPWLWRFHEVHHSSEQMDWLATFRVHPVDQIVNSTIIMVPGLVLGFSPLAFVIYATVYRVHAILLHSNVRVALGPLDLVIASPRYHHWHHANEPDAYDKNFGGQLVIWDYLFRTVHNPATLPAQYGVCNEVPKTYAQQLLAPFRRQRPRRSAAGTTFVAGPADVHAVPCVDGAANP